MTREVVGAGMVGLSLLLTVGGQVESQPKAYPAAPEPVVKQSAVYPGFGLVPVNDAWTPEKVDASLAYLKDIRDGINRLGAPQPAAAPTGPPTSGPEFEKAKLAAWKHYCLDCHSPSAVKAGLGKRFLLFLDDAGTDLRPLQPEEETKCDVRVQNGSMPPKSAEHQMNPAHKIYFRKPQ